MFPSGGGVGRRGVPRRKHAWKENANGKEWTKNGGNQLVWFNKVNPTSSARLEKFILGQVWRDTSK